MVLSKALKAKLSSIPSGVTNLSMSGREWLENRRAFVRPLAMATPPHVHGLLEAPLNNSVVRMELRVLSLSQGRKVDLPFEVWQESWPNFR